MGLETCRMCFSRIVQNAFSLLDHLTAKILESLTSIKVKPMTELSTVICTKCYLNLKLAYRIQQNIIRSEEKLRTRLLSISEPVTATPTTLESEAPESFIAAEECVICGEFPLGNYHYQAHFKKAQFCAVCNCQFETFQSYKQHLSLCQDKQSYQCAKCQATFRYKSLYDMHVTRLHAEVRPGPGLNDKPRDQDEPVKSLELTCGQCGKQFKSKKSLANHSHKTRKCPICDEEMPFNRLPMHLRDHAGVQVCEICGARAKNASSFRSHMFYSHNSARYKCDHCGKVFKKKLALRVHLQKHKGQKTFICETCGKSFYMNYCLQRHIKMTHLKLRPHVCRFCQKGFSTKYAMRTHQRQHTNETPYRCDVCGEGFRQNVSLKSHRRTKHGIKESEVVKCETCGKGFASDHALHSHSRLHQ